MRASFRVVVFILFVFAVSAVAQTFYFLPPNDPEWLRRTPHIIDLDNGNSATPMSIDTTTGVCGWYRINISSPDHSFIVWPGKPKNPINTDADTDRMGVNGVDDGPDTWNPQTLLPEPIVFSALGTSTYFDPSKGRSGGWTASMPGSDQGRCFYSMAAIIYDTDPSKIDAFKCANTSDGSDPCDFDNAPAAGIVRGIPAPKLAPNAKGVLKMQWGNKGGRSATNGWDEADFNAAFNCSAGRNSMICYDMPFQRDHRGLWTFDSDFLCKGGGLDLKSKRTQVYTDATGLCTGTGDLGGGPALGFFPNRLNKDGDLGIGKNEDPPLDATCTYAACPDCAKKYNADPLAPLITEAAARIENCGNAYYTPPILKYPVNPMCYEQGRQSGRAICTGPGCKQEANNEQKTCTFDDISFTDPNLCGPAYPEGAFKEGTNPPIWNFDLRGWRDWASWTNSDQTKRYQAPYPNFRELFAGGNLQNGGNPNIADGAFYKGSKDATDKNEVIQRNQYFCFESHATFIYEAGQKFYFSGDDDIWVFIDSTIVIDNGGNHLAAPGYVDLDSMGVAGGRWAGTRKLEQGEEYALDVFFCDRRQTSSNIRVSTNMYIVQKNGIVVKGNAKDPTGQANICLQQDGAGSCAALLDGGGSQGGATILCDDAVNGLVEFYIINRRLDPESKFLLNPATNPNCTGTGGIYTCYGGITVDETKGTAKVDMNKMTGLAGTQYLFARVKEGKMKPPVPPDEKIATITFQTFVRMAWGDIKDEGGPTITNICQATPVAATGELVPVCFSSGEQEGNTFITGDIGDIGGSTLKLNTTGFYNHKGEKLQVYFDSLGNSPVKWDTTLTLPSTDGEARPNSGSKRGVLVLWVTGAYDQEINPDYYKINVVGKTTDEVTLKSIIPKLQWIKGPGGDTLNITGAARQNKGDKWTIPGDVTSPLARELDGKMTPAWVSEWIKLHLRAYNNETKKVCTTCNYPLFLSRAKTNSASVPDSNANLIGTQNMRIEKGEAAIEISGKVQVLDPAYADFVVRGVSPLEDAKWDSLQFQEPPVPFPETTEIYDDNGDGIGDRLRITYNRGFRADSLPNVIRVQWDKDTTINYGVGTWSISSNGVDTIYTDEAINKPENRAYWGRYLVGNPNLEARATWDKVTIMGIKDIIELKRDPKDTTQGVKFSKNVLTRSETGKIENWASFRTPPPQNKRYDISLSGNIIDKIPAIIVRARYAADEVNKGCGSGPGGSACSDKVTLEFSEPIKVAAASPQPNELKNTFAYMLRDIGENNWDVLKPGFIPASDGSVRFNNSKTMRPSDDGTDSIVSIWFERYRNETDKSGTPMPGDSVKFAAIGKYASFTNNIYVDNNGNTPNPNEIGRQMEGRKPFTPDKIPIGEIDPNYEPGYREDIFASLENNGSKIPDSLRQVLFDNSRPIEILPVRPDCDANCVRREYPGTVGVIFNPDIFNELSDMRDQYPEITDEDITIFSTVFFHTNLGNYVADRNFSVKCNDPIFPIDPATNQPSCSQSRSKLYVAWDMKDSKGRYVGAGAYVGIYDFRWEVYIKSISQTQRKENIERKVEMHGVKRTKYKR